jgi:hypothetical protein
MKVRELLGGRAEEDDPVPFRVLFGLAVFVLPAVGGGEVEVDDGGPVGGLAGLWVSADEADELDLVLGLHGSGSFQGSSRQGPLKSDQLFWRSERNGERPEVDEGRP